MNKRLGKQINNILSSHQIELVFCPFILLDTFISSDVIESTRRASLSEPGEKEQQDFFNGYKLAIISTLFLYLEYVIRNPDIVGISPDPNFQDYWAYTKTPGKDKLKSALRQSHTTSALISRIQSVVSEILRSDSWDEFQGCLGHIQDFSLCLRRIFVKSYKCSEKIRGRWKVIDTEKGLTERAYDILWTYLMNFKMLKGVYSEAYRDYQSRYDIVEDDFEEFGDRELNMTRLHGRDNDFLLHRLPPNQWAKGYAHVTLNCLCKLTNPPIQEKLSGIYSQISKIDTWVKYDRFQRIVRDLLSEIPNFFNPGTRWLFKQKRPIAAIDLRGLLLPVQRISNIEQVKAILGNRVRIVEIESPSATLNFKCLLDGAIVRAKRTKEKALVAEFKHPVRHNEYDYSYAIFMPAYSQVLPMNASMWWVFFDICNNFSGTASRMLTEIKNYLQDSSKWIEILSVKVDKFDFLNFCEEPGYLYLKKEIKNSKKLDNDIRATFPELLLAAYLAKQEAHPVRCRLKPRFLNKELDVVGVKWQKNEPSEIVIFESKGKATTYEELQTEVNKFAEKLKLIGENLEKLSRTLDIPFKSDLKVTGIFVSMAVLQPDDVEIPQSLSLWDFSRFQNELLRERIPREYRMLIRRKILARVISFNSPLFDNFFGRQNTGQVKTDILAI